MRIGFVVNRVETEPAGYTTSHLALAALGRGHEIAYAGVADFLHGADGDVCLKATIPPDRQYRSTKTLVEALRSEEATREKVNVAELDVLFLRNNPAEDRGERMWAQYAGVLFGRAAVQQGVLVVNDPDGLSRAMNKMYLESFPAEVRPRTLISRCSREIREFLGELGGPGILKPLQGSGGESVFLVKDEDAANLNQMIAAVAERGYVIAQEYLPGASKNDLRLFLLNGDILEVDGHVGALERVGNGGDVRTNISAGGSPRKAEITDDHRRIAAAVRPRLIEDGMFLVGLDIADNRIMEINVFSPGGLHCATEYEEVDFGGAVIDALEEKLRLRDNNPSLFHNSRIATL